jgi:hypothetical protein
MSEQQYNEQEMTEYLLGSSSEEDTQRFDAISVTDREFAEQLDATENDLVDAYIHGELTGATLERFETHYLNSVLRRDKVEFARSFQTYAQQHAVQNTGTFVSSQPKRRGLLAEWLFPSEGPKKRQSVLPWGLVAASLVLLTFAGWWAIRSQSTRGNDVVASFLLAPPTRGSDQIPTVAITKNVTAVKMQLELESDDYPGYRIAVTEAAGGKELWQTATIQPTNVEGRKVLELLLPVNTLKIRTYSLAVSGVKQDGDAESVSSYAFRVEIK